MNKEAKQQLAEMQLLMERMDSRMSGYEVEKRKTLIKESLGLGRIEFNSIDDIANQLDKLNGKWIGIAYIQGYPADKIYPGADGYDQSLRSEVGKLDPASRLGQKINKFISSPEYNNPTGRPNRGLMSVKTPPFSGVIKITNYVLQWGNEGSLASSFEKQRLDTTELRRKYGFGNDEASYEADDWRRNPAYGGLGLNPMSRDKRRNDDGSDYIAPYHAKPALNPDLSLWGDNDSYGNPRYTDMPDGSKYRKRALRLNLQNVKSQWYDYLLVDQNGEIDSVENSLRKLFAKSQADKTNDKWTKTIVPTMSQDEQNFLNDLQKMENRHNAVIKQWLVDNVLYIVGIGKSRVTGEKTAFRWVNKNFTLKDANNVDRNELAPIVDKEIQKAYQDIV